MKYAVVDIETTGARTQFDKIIEIAILLTDGQTILDEYQTLIHPERRVPPFITGLTGIHDDMLQDAPKFFQVAKDIQLFTQDAVFVAHNVRFDYSFLKNEFQQLGGTFSRKTLCTVRLARKIIPGLPSYSLGKLCESIDIPLSDRHRAYGDAKATTLLLHKLLADDNKKLFSSFIKEESSLGTLPPQLDKGEIEKLPQKAGVYFFYDDEQRLLYVGKSLNIQKRVMGHFQVQAKTLRDRDFKTKVCEIDFEEMGNELIALLKEAHFIKEHQPLFNKALRRKYCRFGLFAVEEEGAQHLKIQTLHNHEEPLMEFGTRRAAQKYLEKLVEKYKLDAFYTDLKDLEKQASDIPLLHNIKMQAILKDHSYPYESFLIVGPGKSFHDKGVILVEEGCFKGSCFIDGEFAIENVETLKSHLQPMEETHDHKKIILSFLRKRKPGYKLIKV